MVSLTSHTQAVPRKKAMCPCIQCQTDGNDGAGRTLLKRKGQKIRGQVEAFSREINLDIGVKSDNEPIVKSDNEKPKTAQKSMSIFDNEEQQ